MNGVSITVVVAAYNVEDYIGECLESLHRQTLQTCEFIVIDDGSTDGTYGICDRYSCVDSRFKILKNKRNQGTLLVRKNGCELASGKWLTFLDGDDFLASPEVLCDIVSWLESHPIADILQLGFVYDGGSVLQRKEMNDWLRVKGSWEEDGERSIIRKCFQRNEFSWCVCGKVFKTENVEKAMPFIPRVNMTCAEDCFMFFLFCIFSTTFRTWNRNAYVYRLGTGISTRSVSMKNFVRYSREPLIVEALAKVLADMAILHKYSDILVCLKERLIMTQIHRMSCLSGDWSEAFSMLCANVDGEMLACMCAISFKGRQKFFLEKTKALLREPDSPAVNVLLKILNLFMEEGDRSVDAQNKLEVQNRELETMQGQLDSLKNSVSFKLGRAITWLPRLARDCVQCCSGHSVDTVRKCIERVSDVLK